VEVQLMRNFGTFMPTLGMSIQPSTPTTALQAVAEKVVILFKEFCSLAKQARKAEEEIIRVESSGATVPEDSYTNYEDLLAQAAAAHERYASARQELRDLRAEGQVPRVSLSGTEITRRSSEGCS